jgi:hypothetical protein
MGYRGAPASTVGRKFAMKALKSYLFLAAAAGALNAMFAGAVNAKTITFDNIDTGNSFTQIQNGYSGLNWNNFYANSVNFVPGTGYQFGVVSQPNGAFNGGGGDAQFSAPSGTFTLVSAYLTAAFQNEGVNVTGYIGATPVYFRAADISHTTPTLETFNWTGLTSVNWSTFGQLHTQMVLDNVIIDGLPAAPGPVPGVGLAGLAALALAGLYARGRRA